MDTLYNLENPNQGCVSLCILLTNFRNASNEERLTAQLGLYTLHIFPIFHEYGLTSSGNELTLQERRYNSKHKKELNYNMT